MMGLEDDPFFPFGAPKGLLSGAKLLLNTKATLQATCEGHIFMRQSSRRWSLRWKYVLSIWEAMIHTQMYISTDSVYVTILEFFISWE